MPKPTGAIPQIPALASTPTSNPPAGALLLYFKSDGKLYQKSSAGVESQVDTASTPANMATTDTSQTISGAKAFSAMPLLTLPQGILHKDHLTSQALRIWHDRLRFTTPTYETSTDGGTAWTPGTTSQASTPLAGRADATTDAPFGTTHMRWTWGLGSGYQAYTQIQRLVLKFGYVTPGPTLTVTVESSLDGTTWTSRLANWVITGASANQWASNMTDPSDHPYLRLTIAISTTATSGSVARLNGIEFQTPRWGDQGSGFDREMPFAWNGERVVRFQNHAYPSLANVYDLGSGGTRWRDGHFNGTVYVGGQALVKTDDARLSDERPVFGVRAATTANITLSGLQTIDAIALSAGNVVLVKDQTNTAQNGIYVVASGAWTRHAWFDTSAELAGAVVRVREGPQNAGVWAGWISGAGPNYSFARLLAQTQTDAMYAPKLHTHPNTDITGLGTASTRNVPASGNAAGSEVVLGSDARLGDARAPIAHTHPNTDITGLGTASTRNVPASGNAAGSEAVLGSDTRLGDARTPLAHTHTVAYGHLDISTTTAITDGTSMAIPFDVYDVRGGMGSHIESGARVLDISADGLYSISASVQIRPLSDSGRTRINVERNRGGSWTDLFGIGCANAAINVVNPGLATGDTLPLLAGDMLRLQIYQNNAGTLAKLGTFMTAVRVGPL